MPISEAVSPKLPHNINKLQKLPASRLDTTVDQAETDRYWNAIVGNGGEENACGWCQDKWGLSWQITPIALTKAISDPDPAAAKRAFDAMMEMKKIDIAAIEAARRGTVPDSGGVCKECLNEDYDSCVCPEPKDGA